MRIVETRINLLGKNREKGGESRAADKFDIVEDEIGTATFNEEDAG
jgi:hypothetical protein